MEGAVAITDNSPCRNAQEGSRSQFDALALVLLCDRPADHVRKLAEGNTLLAASSNNGFK